VRAVLYTEGVISFIWLSGSNIILSGKLAFHIFEVDYLYIIIIIIIICRSDISFTIFNPNNELLITWVACERYYTQFMALHHSIVIFNNPYTVFQVESYIYIYSLLPRFYFRKI
jgi:hypothetical protein